MSTNPPDGSPTDPNDPFTGIRNLSTGSGPIYDYGGVQGGVHNYNSADRYDVTSLPNPYLGLLSFTYTLSDYYAGREQEVAEAVRKITKPAQPAILYFVVGASGVGKSSFAQAGLLPSLERYYTQYYQNIRYGVVNPSDTPLDLLYDELSKLKYNLPAFAADRGPHGLIALLRRTPATQVNLVVIDQLEELFTQSNPDQREMMLVLLTALAGQSFKELHTHIICTIRSDYIPYLYDNPTLYEAVKSGTDLRAMSEAQLQKAIQQPLWSAYPHHNRRFDKVLLERLAHDAAADATYLPLLQVIVTDMWEHHRLDASYITLTDAIKDKAEAIYRELDNPDLLLTMLTELVKVISDDPPKYARRGMARARLIATIQDHAAADDILNRQVNTLFSIIPTGKADGGEVNIIHESLIENWQRLKDHVDAHRERLLTRGRFEAAFEEWQRSGRQDSHLLSGVRLAEAQQLAAESEIAISDADTRELLVRSEQQQREQQETKALAEKRQQIADSYRLARIALQQLEQGHSDRAVLLGYEAVELDINEASIAALSSIVTQTRTLHATITKHTFVLRVVTFSPDGKFFITAAVDNDAHLWDKSGALIATLSGHTMPVSRIIFSPDSKLVLTTSLDGTAKLWDISDKLVTTFSDHDGGINSATFSPDGQFILTASADGTACLRNVLGQSLTTFSGHEAEVNNATFSPDGKLILTASADNTARLWSTSAMPISILKGHTSSVGSAIFSPNGKLILTTADDSTTRLWNASGKPIATLDNNIRWAGSATFSPNSKLILTTSHDRTAKLWNSSGKHLSTLEDHTSIVDSATFSPNGQFIFTTSHDGTERLWDLSGNHLSTREDHTSKLDSTYFSPDGKLILIVSFFGNAQLCDTLGQPLATLSSHSGRIRSATLNPDSTRILTASDDNTARLWDKSGRLITILKGHQSGVNIATFSPDGKLILTASDGTAVRLWNIEGKHLITLRCHKSKVTSATFSPDGQYILTASFDKTACISDVTGQSYATLKGHDSWVNSATFSPDGKYILTASSDNTARLWDRAGNYHITIKGHTRSVNGAIFNHDGKLILTASDDNTARLWDRAGQPIVTLSGHADAVKGAIFSSDGQFILTASQDGTARIWNMVGQLIRIIEADVISFTPDATRMFVRSPGNVVQVLPIFPEDLLAIAACRVDRVLTEEELRYYNISRPYFNLSKRICPPPVSWLK